MNQNDKANLAKNSLLLAVNCSALWMDGYKSISWWKCELNLKSEIHLGVQPVQPHLLFPAAEFITSWFMGLVFFPVIQTFTFCGCTCIIKACQWRWGRSVKVEWVHSSLQLPVEYKTNQNHKLTSRGYSNLYICCSCSLLNSAASRRTRTRSKPWTQQVISTIHQKYVHYVCVFRFGNWFSERVRNLMQRLSFGLTVSKSLFQRMQESLSAVVRYMKHGGNIKYGKRSIVERRG